MVLDAYKVALTWNRYWCKCNYSRNFEWTSNTRLFGNLFLVSALEHTDDRQETDW